MIRFGHGEVQLLGIDWEPGDGVLDEVHVGTQLFVVLFAGIVILGSTEAGSCKWGAPDCVS